MKLEVGYIHIKDFCFGSKMGVDQSILTIDKDSLVEYIKGLDARIIEVVLDIVKPGDSVRIMPVKDVIEPRVKVAGSGCIFPGFNPGEEAMVGEGKTHVLKGVAVVTTGHVVGFQEGIIDMAGPGAQYTPFSKTMNLVVRVEVDEHCKSNQYQHEAVLRKVGQAVARWIGLLGKDVQPTDTQSFETLPLPQQLHQYPDLPKVGYVYMLQSQGLLHDTYYYGVDVKTIVPTLMYPTEAMDGAITSGNCVSACDKNPTYVHQNSPIIEELYKRHGQDYNFIGVIITNENVTLADKERSSNMVTKLAVQLGWDAAIISEEGFGNPDADLMMNCRKLEEAGIKTVLLTDEYAGWQGESQSLADAHPAANAVISNGNANQIIQLPALERVIGYAHYADMIAGGFEGSLHQDGSISIEIQAITGATSELGFHNLTTVAG